MAYEGGKGRGGPKGFGGSKGGTGEKRPYVKREGSYDRKPRAEGSSSYGDKKPYVKREGGYDRKPRAEGSSSGERKPYVKREGGYERKPRAEGSSYGERKPYVKREGGYDRKPRAEGSSYGERKPYVKREGGYERKPRAEGSSYGDKKPYVKREGGYDRKPRAEGSSYGERKPYVKREGGFDRAPREGGYERKPRAEGSSYGERKPYVKREGGFDRKPREGGYDRKPREDFGGERKPFRPRESFDGDRPQRGEGSDARFDGKRKIRREREVLPYSTDGWLVGYHAVLAALKAGRRAVRNVWLLSEASGELADVLGAHPDWAVEIKSKPDFEQQFGDAVHQGVAVLVGNLPQPTLPELLATKPQLLVALDQVTDPHNLGAVVRSCAAFGATGVIVTEHRSVGVNATAAKAAAGAMELVPVVEVVNLVQSIEMLQEAGFTVIGLAGEAETEISSVEVKGPLCLVIGSEGDGLRRLTRERCDTLVKIAIQAAIESLNVSVATGIALSVLARK